jgi:replicative DNA helicase
MSDFNQRGAVFTPAETSALGVERIKEMEANRHRAMPLEIDDIGNYLAPLMPGELCAVQAQTSNYKSGFINMWEHSLASHLKKQGRADEVIIHVDTESTIEGLAVQEIARGSDHTVADLSRGNVRDWSKVIKAAGQISTVNIYRIGAALGRDDMPDLYLSNIYRAIRYMTDGELIDRKLVPACIFVDYLQALPIDLEVKTANKKDQRRLQVRDDVYRLRRMASYFKCPVVVGVQAKQNLNGHAGLNMQIPGTYDGEETSAIAQRFDRVISMWMPKTTHTIGEVLTHRSITFDVDEDLIWIKVCKQRGGLPSGKAWICRIDYRTNTIGIDR